MLLIFTPKITPRIRYIFSEILERIIGVEYAITDNVDEFLIHKGARLSYGGIRIENEIHIEKQGILLEKGINEQVIDVFETNGYKAFFKSKRDSDFPFDMFSAAFYLITRYEEYLLFKPDTHGRFSAQHSIAFKNGFLQQPIINIWASAFKKFLESNFAGLIFEERTFDYSITFDIDHAYNYRAKGLTRAFFGVLKNVVVGNFAKVKERLAVHLFKEKDPFDTYQYIADKQALYGFQPVFFFLLANFGKYDRNNPIYNKQFQYLIKHISDTSIVGIHPSYASNEEDILLQKEINRLSEIIKRPVTRSRQHYIMLSFPVTYQRLLEHSIRHDYSMGYADTIGFRAGVANDFYWYDLVQDIKTPLKIHPFMAMDVTLKDYMKLSIDEAGEQLTKLIQDCKKVNGHFTLLWHNVSLSENEEWRGWRQVFENVLNVCRVK